MKKILALALVIISLLAVPAVPGDPDIFESPAAFLAKGAELVSGQTLEPIPGSPIIEPITFPVFEGPGFSEAQEFRKWLNRDDALLYDVGLRMTGNSELAHLLQPEFDPNVIDTGEIIEDLSRVPPGQLK